VPGGAFNVAELIRQLGLKPVSADEMGLRQGIQPVLNIGNLADATPPHVSPSAIFGALLVGAPGTVGIIEVQCLSPGGGFIDWFTFNSNVSNARFRVSLTASGAATPVIAAGVTSNVPIVSVINQGDVAASGDPNITLFQNGLFNNLAPRSMFIPRGTFFQIECATVNISATVGFGWREVPVPENIS